MKPILKKLASALALLIWGAVCVWGQAPEETVTWKVSQGKTENGLCEIIFDGTIAQGWHTYSVDHELTPTEVTFTDPKGYTLEGGLYEILPSKELDGEHVYFDRIRIGQKIRITAEADSLKGEIAWRSCNDQFCASPEYLNFSIPLEAKEATVAPADSSQSSGSLWGLILEAILWGFAMLLTPCVFPMIPMTISFFMKGSSTPAAGRFKAFMYGLFIVLLYTVPISAIIGITYIFGGETVTADIFNWLATHWLPNIIFFIVFMIFAASFFGAFEITLPSSLVNKSDQNSDKGGLAGIFFMALTLVLVSFSCTGPIVGSVLIKSTQGEFWTPMVTMLAFSIAFALPFTIFAMFPSLLKKLKSGSWLNSVKVVLGFIEVALGFKFLSVADQTYHWGLLDREIYLGIWIVVFTLLGLYLLGKIRFEADSEVKHIGVFRLFLVIVDFTFVVYMIPGMFGAPLKALSGYLPPIETQDFVIWSKEDGSMPVQSLSDVNAGETGLHKLPLGLTGYLSIDEALVEAKKVGKPVFVDISGLACVNCREMEQRVWSDPQVLQLLRDEFVIAVLYTDDKEKLPESEWVTTKNGKVLKDRGRVNAYYVRERFDVSAQPNYVILDPQGNQITPIRGYNLDIDGFVEFLKSGLK
ncbi:MAG: cytochrome c biogenesis protein CcdA [Bacteroides sp.]|nr:thioredoxin family protein [Bacteroides sp.]MDD6150203.1 cytochrome c biogenesis protein CcdA [Bacteroides sp.]MDY2972823.1 cytochrome c biogenesis protein CcdA [Candidatus Cryptobacteroides sp.]HAW06499.1 thiol:disulfide interchange protein [Rikenellaceae bacterium]